MGRSPYQTHMSAQDPERFARGFAAARPIACYCPELAVAVHELLASHVGKLPWPVFGVFPETPYAEGLLLGLSGLVDLAAYELERAA
jgi:hypothetical protein